MLEFEGAVQPFEYGVLPDGANIDDHSWGVTPAPLFPDAAGLTPEGIALAMLEWEVLNQPPIGTTSELLGWWESSEANTSVDVSETPKPGDEPGLGPNNNDVAPVEARGKKISIWTTVYRLQWEMGAYEGDQATGTDVSSGTDGGGGEAADEDVIEIKVNFDRPMTAAEEQALKDLALGVQRASVAIAAIPDNAKITLKNGATVSGAELKEIWAKTDFFINDNSHTYANGTQRGEANYNGGDPRVSYNIQTVVGYARSGEAGMNYLILHEIGHMVPAGRQGYDEQVANDIARAVSFHAGQARLENPLPGGGYSTADPLVFAEPLTYDPNDKR